MKKILYILRWYLLSLLPLIVFTFASYMDGNNFVQQGQAYASGVIETIMVSPNGMLIGMVMSAILLVIVAMDDIFSFVAKLIKRLFHNDT